MRYCHTYVRAPAATMSSPTLFSLRARKAHDVDQLRRRRPRRARDGTYGLLRRLC
jgi:hypothetical protein